MIYVRHPIPKHDHQHQQRMKIEWKKTDIHIQNLYTWLLFSIQIENVLLVPFTVHLYIYIPNKYRLMIFPSALKIRRINNLTSRDFKPIQSINGADLARTIGICPVVAFTYSHIAHPWSLLLWKRVFFLYHRRSLSFNTMPFHKTQSTFN